jgi:hypothetical protein
MARQRSEMTYRAFDRLDGRKQTHRGTRKPAYGSGGRAKSRSTWLVGCVPVFDRDAYIWPAGLFSRRTRRIPIVKQSIPPTLERIKASTTNVEECSFTSFSFSTMTLTAMSGRAIKSKCLPFTPQRKARMMPTAVLLTTHHSVLFSLR